MNHSFESDLFSKLVNPVDKTDLNDSFMNQTHPVHEFNSLTEKLNHSFEPDIYSKLVNPVDN